jgi:hypothetical protein
MACRVHCCLFNSLSLLLLAAASVPLFAAQQPAASLGVFQDHSDVGAILQAGSIRYDASANTYTLSGSGGYFKSIVEFPTFHPRTPIAAFCIPAGNATLTSRSSPGRSET